MVTKRSHILKKTLFKYVWPFCFHQALKDLWFSKVSGHCPYLTVSTLILFYIAILLIFKYTITNIHLNRVCTKYWPKPKKINVVDSDILLIKDKLSPFAPAFHFAKTDQWWSLMIRVNYKDTRTSSMTSFCCLCC